MKTIITGFAALLLGTACAAAQQQGPGRALVASDTVLQISNDPVVTSEPNGAVGRAFIPPYSGTVRVKWEVRSADGTQVRSLAYVDFLSECERLSASTAFVQKACNIRVAGGMPIRVDAVVIDSNTNDQVSIRNVRLYYRVVDATGESIIYELPD